MHRYVVLENQQGERSIGDQFAEGMVESVSPQTAVHSVELQTREAADLSRNPRVAAWAPVMPVRLIQPLTSGSGSGEPWGVDVVRRGSPYRGQGVTVAIIDSGIDASHPAFANIKLAERDFTGDGNGDVIGHGTHCAGTFFGGRVAGHDIGVAPEISRALIAKVFGATAVSASDGIFTALQWAVDEGADVISLSLGFDFPLLVENLVRGGMPIKPATSIALDSYRKNLRVMDAFAGMLRARDALGPAPLIVAATGNQSARPKYTVGASVPAAGEGVVAVAAVQSVSGALEAAYFSNSGATVSAPGVNILSAAPGGGLQSMCGTSMACPHAAGVAALWWEAVRASRIKASVESVRAKFLAAADASVLSPGFSADDVGLGVAVAPPN